ncbi:low molecular weight protein arginine phosphatase [Tumebacillus lipolyticus]|uniref:Low molecular weight protein arginine phosphatase n=1 Tax=Tumebacillus lipolyticus TaxID=1280370 RepID=A0ABW4ZWT8_9BACL
MKLLFVCTGNTCRSAMAEPLMRKRLQQAGLGGRVEVRSAGVAAMSGSPASQGAINVLKAKGLDGAAHAASPLDRELVDWADLILTMGQSHKRAILERYIEALDKTCTLKEFVDDDPQNLAILDEMGALQAEAQMKQSLFLMERADEVQSIQERYQRGAQGAEQELMRLQQQLEATVEAESSRMMELMGQLPDYEIADPFGGSQQVYDACAVEIDTLLAKLIQKLSAENHSA